MKFAVLSGAYKNAGDFLIVDRSIKLLQHVYPDCEIQTYERRLSLEEHLDEINRCDAVIFAGGPAYSPAIYPDQVPLVADLERIKVPMYTLGLGWYGRSSANSVIYESYRFTEDTKRLLARLERDGTLTCRDWFSVRALKNNGFSNIQMTGCPAWYDLNNVHRTQLREGLNLPYRKICFSDPADPANVAQSLAVVQYIRQRHPDAQLVYVFHRGIQKDAFTSAEQAYQYSSLAEQLAGMGVEVQDISYSVDGFHVYDDCDLHIGMRVHAHIYNLSLRNVSILIEEDGRGAGVNDALGLFSIKAYEEWARHPLKGRDRVIRKLYKQVSGAKGDNPWLLRQLDDYLFMLEQSNYQQLQQAFCTQQRCFTTMTQHVSAFMHNPLEGKK